MSFAAYLENIRKLTGKTPEDFYAAAKAAGLVGPKVRATQVTDWLKAQYGLGLGHARAIWAVFVQNGWAGAPKRAKPRRR